MTQFPEKIYGKCPCGHNAATGTSGGANSTNQITPADEEMPLVWSEYWQQYVCKLCFQQGVDRIHDLDAVEGHKEDEEFLQSVGYSKTIS